MNNRLLKTTIKITATFLIIILFFLCIEISLRVYDFFRYSRLFKEINTKAGKVVAPFDETQIYLFKTGKCIRDADFFWKYTSKLKDYKLNSLGMRDYELSRFKPEETYRIFVFGGSHPFGL